MRPALYLLACTAVVVGLLTADVSPAFARGAVVVGAALFVVAAVLSPAPCRVGAHDEREQALVGHVEVEGGR